MHRDAIGKRNSALAHFEVKKAEDTARPFVRAKACGKRQTRQMDGKYPGLARSVRQPWRLIQGQLDQMGHARCRLMGGAEQPCPALLDQTREDRVWASDNSSMDRQQVYLIVANQAGKKATSLAFGDQRKGKPALARAGRAAQHHGSLAYHDNRGVRHHGPAGRFLHGLFGSQTVKRAPATSPLPGANRFCAEMRPLCASTICREIDRPSPEFWPNP